MIVSCKFCSKTFFKTLIEIKRGKNHFCSRSCSTKHNNIGIRRNPPKERICKKCNVLFLNNKKHRSKNFCSTCKHSCTKTDATKLQTLGFYLNKPSIKNKHPSWKHSHVRILNRSWNKNLLMIPCQVCGYNKHVELAHIKPISQFNEESTLGEINNPNNILVLCPNHHWEFDNNIINIDQISAR